MRILISIALTFFFSAGKAQTGVTVPQMASCDNLVQNFMTTHGIPGLSMALSKNGKLLYHRGFGTANLAGTEAVNPYHLFRIASISKPITSIAIMKLYQEGLLNMNDKVFGTGGILQNHPFLSTANISDGNIYNITVQHLLEHSAGWNRDVSCFPNPTTPYPWNFSGCDPIIAPLHVTQSNGTSNPVQNEDMIYFLLEKGLDFPPGTDEVYSNIGFLVLGEIIEQLTGMSYESYVKTQILEPLNACDLHVGGTYLSEKKEREVEYTGSGYTSKDFSGSGNNVPWEYGGYSISAMDAHGGWIASTRDLLRVITAVDGFTTKPDILTPATIGLMTTPSANNPYYSKGWSVNSSNNWWHFGALTGSATFMARTNSGYTWAIFLNKRVIGTTSGAFWNDLDALPWNCINQAASFPTHDLFLTPTVASSALNTTTLGNASCSVNWVAGDGLKRIVVAKANSPVDAYPVDGMSYNASTSFGLGSDLGNQNFVVYDGTGNSTLVSNLISGTTYYFRIFEYNQSASTGNHKLYLLKGESHLYLDPVGDLSPVLKVVPSNLQGISTVSIVAKISEVGNRPTDGSLITVRMPVDQRLTFAWDPTLTNVGFDQVQNSQWTYSTNGLSHSFRTNSTISALSSLSFGYIATYDPQNTAGQSSITVSVVPASGGETNYTNNSDAEIIVYFD